jgi:hypothetical protein
MGFDYLLALNRAGWRHACRRAVDRRDITRVYTAGAGFMTIDGRAYQSPHTDRSEDGDDSCRSVNFSISASSVLPPFSLSTASLSSIPGIPL